MTAANPKYPGCYCDCRLQRVSLSSGHSSLQHIIPTDQVPCVEARVLFGCLEVSSLAEGNQEGSADRGLIGRVCGMVDCDGVHICRIVR